MNIKKHALQAAELEGKTLDKFFELVASKLGYDITDENLLYDCRKLLIADNVQNYICKAYETANPEGFKQRPREAREHVMMLLLNFGPKVKHDLLDYTVEVLEGFVTFKEEV